MSQMETVRFTYEKRRTFDRETGDFERAEMVGTLELDEGDDVEKVVGELMDAVHSRVQSSLASATDTRRPRPAEPEAAEPKAAEPKADNPKRQTFVDLPTGTAKVRGNNATELSRWLKECFNDGHTIPEEQIERLPKAYARDLRDYFAANSANSANSPAAEPAEPDDPAEPAGSHDDPDPQTGGLLEGETGDTPAAPSNNDPGPSEQEAAPETTDVLADLFPEDTGGDGAAAPEEVTTEITVDELMAFMRDAASRVGRASLLKPAVEEFAADGRSLASIDWKQRPAFKAKVEAIIRGDA